MFKCTFRYFYLNIYQFNTIFFPLLRVNKFLFTQVRIEFNPTVPHCSLATLIGLCIRVKVERSLPHNIKLDIYIKNGAHTTEDESNFTHDLL